MEITNKINRDRQYLLIIVLSAIIFFIPNLGKVHLFDWDEINFAESAREMIVTGNYHRVQINFQPFWEKPPLFFWLQSGCMHIFGINEFAARLPNALFGIITLITLFFIGKKEKNSQFGFIWAISYLGTFLPHLYFKSGIIDPVFNYFIFIGIYFMYRSLTAPNKRAALGYVALAGTLIGLSNLTKGPVGLLVFLISFFIYFCFTKFRSFPSIKKIIVFILCFSAITLCWFGEEIFKNGFWFLKEFLKYQADLFLVPVAGHKEPIYYHFVVVFLGCFPFSVFALPYLFKKTNFDKPDLSRLMKILFWTVLILFTIVTTKIVHYSSLTYMPLAFIASVYMYKLWSERSRPSTYILIILAITGLIFCTLLAGLPLVAAHKEWLIPYLKDPFAVASLNVNVQWSGYEFLFAVFYFVIIIISLIILSKKKAFKGLMLLFYSTASFLFIYMLIVVPKIEMYSQGPAIKFYQTLIGKDVYVTPVGFKSYAQYFYSNKQGTDKYDNEDSLLRGAILKPAYFVVKINFNEFDTMCKSCTLVGQEGGFKFYKREAISN